MRNNDVEIHDRDNNPTLTLSDLVCPLWKARKLMLVAVILAVAAGIAGTLLLSKYRSEGFFQFGGPIPVPSPLERERREVPDSGIALSDFKRYSASIGTAERFAEYIQEKNLDSAAVQDLSDSIARRGMTDIIEPVYPFTRADARLLTEQPRGSSNNVIGLRISYAGKTPEKAQQMVELLGDYAMDTIIYMTYADTLRAWSDELATNLLKQENAIIEEKLRLDEYSRRMEELRQIIARNPATADQSGRQVVAVDEKSARYLPLSTQLATTEVMATDANEKIRQIQRDLQQNRLYLDYYSRARALLKDTKSGDTVLKALEGIRDVVFQDKAAEDDVIKEAHNRITLNIRMAQNTYIDRSRFIAGPTLPSRSTISMPLALILSAGAGFVLAALFVYIRQWARRQ